MHSLILLFNSYLSSKTLLSWPPDTRTSITMHILKVSWLASSFCGVATSNLVENHNYGEKIGFNTFLHCDQNEEKQWFCKIRNSTKFFRQNYYYLHAQGRWLQMNSLMNIIDSRFQCSKEIRLYFWIYSWSESTFHWRRIFCGTTLYNQNCLFGHHAGPINTELVQVLNVHYYHFTIYVHDYNG